MVLGSKYKRRGDQQWDSMVEEPTLKRLEFDTNENPGPGFYEQAPPKSHIVTPKMVTPQPWFSNPDNIRALN